MIRGSCLCSAVAFEIDGRVTPIQLCYAQRCQKSTGSAFSPELCARRRPGRAAVPAHLHQPSAGLGRRERRTGKLLGASTAGAAFAAPRVRPCWFAPTAPLASDNPGVPEACN